METHGSEKGKSSAYTASIRFDRRLYRQDIAGSVAHARMLAEQGIISDKTQMDYRCSTDY